jgi:pimeloyl-ACP methyl ester carboxylesterase/DNA-binding CsgD family transcriptional regulator
VPAAANSANPPQEIRFCRAPDGVRIAYAVHGSGPPLLIATCWLSHLQYDWESPVWRHFLAALGKVATVVRYDERGHGLSDWDVDDYSLEARIGDLEAVADDAGFDHFALMAMSQGGPPSIAYAVRHPERVSRLLFVGSYAAALPDPTPEDLELQETFEQMIKVGWARPDSAFRRVFTSMMIPGATEEQMKWLDELQRVSVSAENAYTARQERIKANVIDLLPQLDLPTLVLHGRDDRMNEFESSRLLASSIAGARLVALESSNHIVLEDEPAWPVFLREVTAFLEPDRQPASHSDMHPTTQRGDDPTGTLSARELEVLTLAADGQDNEDIARMLHLSVRTVERHLQNIYVKLDVRGKSARTAAVARLLTRA